MIKAAKFQMMLAMAVMFLNGACSSVPNFYSMGEPEVEVKSPAWFDASDEEWNGVQDKRCITHLYRCRFNEQGVVTDVKAMDLSQAAFHEFTEEALRRWKFAPGKAGQCFIDFIYTDDLKTRMVMLGEERAQKITAQRLQERNPPAAEKKKPVSIKKVFPKYPKSALLSGQLGMVRAQFDVNPEGVPENIRILESIPDGTFDRASRAALSHWRYKPLADEPGLDRSNVTVSFYFNIDGGLGYDCPLAY